MAGWKRTCVAVVTAIAAITLVAACGDDASSGRDIDAGAAGAVLGSAAGPAVVECVTDATPTGTDEPEAPPSPPGESEPPVEVPDLSPPTIPQEATPPTTEPGEQPGDWDGEPLFGGFRVDPTEHGCVDVAVQLRAGQKIIVMTHGDDGKVTTIQVFGPDREMVVEWETSGDAQTYEGYEWLDTGMPLDGVYVFRIIHRGGNHNSFVVAFYGES